MIDLENKMEKKKTKVVSKATYKRNVKKFSGKAVSLFDTLQNFVDKNFKGKKKREKMLDEVCGIIDNYIHLNLEIYHWCNTNKVDADDFFCDVNNTGFNDLAKK